MEQSEQNNRVSFEQAIEEALERYHDATWLGANSPLASPYLLHDYLLFQADNAQARGEALQNILQIAVAQIEDKKYADRYRQIIQERFFTEKKKRLSEDQMLGKLSIERRTFFDNRKNAVKSLGRALVKLLTPALRLEAPIRIERPLFGRWQQLSTCKQTLIAGKTLLITGNSGVGKTTLASHLTQEWQQQHVFWFTIRLGFNDNIGSLLFTLGCFLHKCGESTLWRELIAQPRLPDLNQALTFIRYALERLKQQEEAPLLCIDEIDLLQPALYETHGQIINLLASLRGLASLLLVGQHALLDADSICQLDGLTHLETKTMMESAQVKISDAELQNLYQQSNGNPRLIELCITLHKDNEPIANLLQALVKAPPLEYLLSRSLQRLEQTTPIACSVLMELAVHLGPAPVDVWQNNAGIADALEQLVVRHLAKFDGRGGVALLPIFRDILYQSLPEDKRRNLHTRAAIIYAMRGAYTTVAYHLVRAGEPERVIWEWGQYRQQEINQGQGGAALQILRGLIPMTLHPSTREELTLQIAYLERLQGNTAQALHDLHSILWKTPILTLEANTLEGVIANDLGNFPRVEEIAQRALVTAESIVEARLVHIHKGLGWRHLRERELELALHEAQLARYEAENFEGYVMEALCKYELAEQHFLNALKTAEELNHTEGIAKTCNNLARLYARLSQFSQAESNLARADECFAKIQKISDLCSAKINWGLIFNLAGQHDKAIVVLEQALQQFDRYQLTIPSWTDALIHQGLAEAYLGLDEIEKALGCVDHAIKLEETDILPDSHRTLGEILLKQRELDRAEQRIRHSLELLRRIPDLYLEGYAWRALAQVYILQGKEEQACQAKQAAIELFTKIKLPNEVEKTLSTLSGI